MPDTQKPLHEGTLAPHEARRWIRRHWAMWIAAQDLPGPPWPPAGVDAVWADECRRIADKIAVGAAHVE